jgi:hypothetical protein
VSLYRYRSAENFDREITTIERAYLHCSPFTELNDPMEGGFRSGRRFRNSPRANLVRNRILDSKSDLRICAFSEFPDDPVMWAHYAGQFKGMCISYSMAKLRRNLREGPNFVRMFYSNDVPTVHSATDDVDELARMILSYKNNRWAYEREWRMFSGQTRVRYKDAKCIRTIRLGYRMSDEHKQEILELSQRLNCRVMETMIEGYEMRFKRLN